MWHNRPPAANPGGNTGNTYVSGGSYVGGGSFIGGGTGNVVNPAMGQVGMPGLPGQPGMPINSQTGGAMQQPPYPTNPGAIGNAPNYPQPGMQMNPQAQNAAAQMIGQILTTPRPGGMPVNNGPGGVVGGGIAGVASNAESESIMVYNDRSNYSEWEFVWDPAKWRPPPNPLTGAIGTPASQLGSMPGQSSTGTPASQLGSMPGQPPGTPSSISPPQLLVRKFSSDSPLSFWKAA